MVFGNIGPRRPAATGENCFNCGSYFIMEPGYRLDEETGVKYASWKCAGCGRQEEWGVGRDPNWQPQEIKSSDFIE